MNIYLEHIIIQIKIHIISTCNTVFGGLTKLTFIWHIFVPLTKLLLSIYSLTTFNWIQQLSCHTCISLYYTKCFSINFSSIPNNLSNQFSYTCRDLWNFIFTKIEYCVEITLQNILYFYHLLLFLDLVYRNWQLLNSYCYMYIVHSSVLIYHQMTDDNLEF